MKHSDYDFPHEYNHANYREIYCWHQVSEAQVVQNILALLHAYWVDAAAIDAGGARARGRLMAAAKGQGVALGDLAKMANPGIPKGWADIEATLAPDGRALFIEVKQPRWIGECGRTLRPEGQATKEQLEFLSEKKVRGALVMVAWSSEDVEHYLAPELHRNRKALSHGVSRTQRTGVGLQPYAPLSKHGE